MSRDVEKLVIVGSSLAGLRAAEGARAAGHEGKIVIIGEEITQPYDRPALSKQCLIEGDEIPSLRETADMEGLNVEWVVGSPATGLETENREVIVGENRIAYDALVITTGATPRSLPNLPAAKGIYTLRNDCDVTPLRQGLQEEKKLTIIGAGIIGAEIATAARKFGCEVTIIEATEYPLERALGRNMGLELSRLHEQHGTDLRCGVTVSNVETADGKVAAVELSDGSRVATDMLLISIGVIPNTGWLADSGIELARDGSILCDEYLQTSVDGVYAAGDVITWPNSQTGVTARLETWTSANEQGALAGGNAVRDVDNAQAYLTVPYFWSDWYGRRVQFVGTATEEPPVVVQGELGSEKYIALFRKNDQLVGALAINEPAKIMKDRRRIRKGASWQEALNHYGHQDADQEVSYV